MGTDLSRLVDRLRSLPEPRLTRLDDRLGGRSIATASHEFAQWCGEAAAGAASGEVAAAPEVPTVPRLAELATGDQVQVLGQELIAVLTTMDPAAPVWLGGTRLPASQVSTELRERIEFLRSVV